MASPLDERNEVAAGGELAATVPGITRVRLTQKMLRELRLALLSYSSPFSVELELVEQRYSNGDIVVRLARPDKPSRGELILGTYSTGRREAELLYDDAA
jgi:hypothetical protein